MLVVFIRSVILYVLVVLIMRLMGKRQIGELQPFEFTIALMIADLAAVPMADIGTPLLYGVIPIVTLLLLQVCLSCLTMKFPATRRFICGKPSIMIHKGVICESVLKAQRYNLNDLLEQLRSAGYFDISQVEYAILETGGMLTVIPKTAHRPATPADLHLAPAQEELPINLIMDGRWQKQNLTRYGIDREAIRQAIIRLGFPSHRRLLLATLTGDRLFLQSKAPDQQVITLPLPANEKGEKS